MQRVQRRTRHVSRSMGRFREESQSLFDRSKPNLPVVKLAAVVVLAGPAVAVVQVAIEVREAALVVGLAEALVALLAHLIAPST